MKILIDDGFQIEVGTGIGQYTKMIIEDLKQCGERVNIVNYLKLNDMRKNKRRLIYIPYFNLISKKYEKEYDVIHYTNYAVPFVKNKKGINVVTIHDLVCYRYPDTLPFMYRKYNQLMIKNSMKKADMVITVSESIKSEIKTYFPKYLDKVEVVGIGVKSNIKKLTCEEIGKVKVKENLDVLYSEKYFLFVGTIEKRKNVDFLVECFIKAKNKYKEMQPYKLVLAGRSGYGYDEITSYIENSKFKEDIIFTGYIDENELLYLYNTAKAYVFPTKYEGFGMPQIECMMCNTPIILSDIPTNKEISREYGEFFELGNENSLIDKFLLFARNRYDYKKKSEISKKILSRFNREELSKLLIEKYEDALRRKRSIK